MPDLYKQSQTDKSREEEEASGQPPSIRFTARLSVSAYNAITELQRVHRTKTGRALPLWKVVDAAILAYAKRQGIKVGV